MKSHNPRDGHIINWRWVINTSFVLSFVWMAGFAFQASEHLIGCISLLMACVAPFLKLEDEGYE
jgi:hypothetical protein